MTNKDVPVTLPNAARSLDTSISKIKHAHDSLGHIIQTLEGSLQDGVKPLTKTQAVSRAKKIPELVSSAYVHKDRVIHLEGEENRQAGAKFGQKLADAGIDVQSLEKKLGNEISTEALLKALQSLKA